MGYVQRDMRAVLGRRIAQPPSRVALRPRIAQALPARSCCAPLRARVAKYGRRPDVAVPATCEVTEPPQCDQLDFITAGAVETPPIPWQDRGTFQQAAEPGAG